MRRMAQLCCSPSWSLPGRLLRKSTCHDPMLPGPRRKPNHETFLSTFVDDIHCGSAGSLEPTLSAHASGLDSPEQQGALTNLMIEPLKPIVTGDHPTITVTSLLNLASQFPTSRSLSWWMASARVKPKLTAGALLPSL